MNSRKTAVMATLFVSSLAALWAGPAAASCKTCFTDPITGKEICLNLCFTQPPWWFYLQSNPKLKSPIDISSITRELNDVVADPEPQTWMLVCPKTRRQFVVDLQQGTMTEIVAGSEVQGR